MSYVLTASATADGGPIYLASDRRWTRRIVEARLLEADAAQLQVQRVAAEEQAVACDPYVIPVSTADATIEPLTLKERIRATGPTVAYGPRG